MYLGFDICVELLNLHCQFSLDQTPSLHQTVSVLDLDKEIFHILFLCTCIASLQSHGTQQNRVILSKKYRNRNCMTIGKNCKAKENK